MVDPTNAAPKKGRPSSYSEEIVSRICEALAGSSAGLAEICRSDETLPHDRTVYRWLADPKHEEFRQRYASAREAQAHFFGDEILEISDDGTNDWMKRNVGEETVVVADHEHISRSKLRVDSRKWLMSKLAPKKYGDKLEATVQGPNGGPVQTELTVKFVG